MQPFRQPENHTRESKTIFAKSLLPYFFTFQAASIPPFQAALRKTSFSFQAKSRIIAPIFHPHTKNDPRGHFFVFIPLANKENMDIQSILDTTLPGLGYELVDHELTAQGILRVFIDKAGGITVDDCAAVSNHLSRVFMVENIDYKNLEISSPGLDRPLKKAADFIRFAGSQIKLKTRLPVDGQKNFIGRLEAFNDNTQTLTLSFDGKTAEIELGNIDKARLKPEFKF